jgi:hypothetical protein
MRGREGVWSTQRPPERAFLRYSRAAQGQRALMRHRSPQRASQPLWWGLGLMGGCLGPTQATFRLIQLAWGVEIGLVGGKKAVSFQLVDCGKVPSKDFESPLKVPRSGVGGSPVVQLAADPHSAQS